MIMDANIIKYNDKYYNDLKNICFSTASMRYKENEECLYTLYLDYYLKYEKDNSFIIIDNDKAVGYILSVKNHKDYIKNFKKEFLPKLKELNKSIYKEAKLELLLARFMGKKYTSHLHIDILNEYQRKGYGKKLINILLDDLDKKQVKGIYLGCGYNNKNAIEFYKKMGFSIFVKSKFTGVIFKKRIGE